MDEKFIRHIYYYKSYYLDFFQDLPKPVREKFNWTLGLIATLERIPTKFFKHIEGTDGLFEIRVEVSSDIFRVFCFFDEGRLVILINGFQKKTQKTPKSEIERAQKLKAAYFNEKETK